MGVPVCFFGGLMMQCFHGFTLGLLGCLNFELLVPVWWVVLSNVAVGLVFYGYLLLLL